MVVWCHAQPIVFVRLIMTAPDPVQMAQGIYVQAPQIGVPMGQPMSNAHGTIAVAPAAGEEYEPEDK